MIDNAITRKEKYLSKIAGDDVTLPEYPITRIEQYLARIAEGGSGGGGDYVPAAQGVENAGKFLVVGSDGNVTTRSLAAIPVTLTAASWSDNRQTVVVQGVLADEMAQLIQPIPASASRDAYEASAVRAISQAANAITFDCQSPAPSADLTVYVVVTPLGGAS